MEGRDLSINADDRAGVRATLAAIAAEDARALASAANGAQAEAKVEPIVAEVPADEPPVVVEVTFATVAYDYVPAEVTVRLQHPFVHEGERVSSIDIRPPRFDHIEAYFAKQISRMELFAEMTGVPEAALAALRWSDSLRVLGACQTLCPDLG